MPVLPPDGEILKQWSESPTPSTANSAAYNFLEQLRPGGPWVLTAIIPDDTMTLTITAKDAAGVDAFINKHDGKRNLYYSVNPTRKEMTIKAAKTDIAAIEYLIADLDPRADETPQAAKARYVAAIENHKPAITAIIDSGNGIQGLFRLAEPIKLEEPIIETDKDGNVVKDEKGRPKKVFPPKTTAIIADAEERIKALMERLGSDAGTQNIDRLLRLPGTTNLPNKSKVEKGRVPCPTAQIKFNGATCKLEDFPKPAKKAAGAAGAATAEIKIDWVKATAEPLAGWLKTVADLPDDFNAKGRMIVASDGNIADLSFDLIEAGRLDKPYRKWSAVSMALTSIFKADGFTPEQIAAALMCPLKCNSHVAKLVGDTKKRRAIERMLNRSYEPAINTAFENDHRPVIDVTAKLDIDATLGEKALLDAGVAIYQRSETLMRPIVEEVDASHGRRTKTVRFKQVSPVYLRDLLSQHANWQKYDARNRQMVACRVPYEIAATILEREGTWTFPAVAGVIATPTMRPDGSLLTEPGYDPATRLLLVEPPPMPPIPDEPTREDALAALALLKGLLEEFPLVDNVSRAVALSGFITPIVRGAFPVAPMHGTDAPVAGSGKSYLLDTTAAIATGQLMPVISAGPNNEETEKRLGTEMMTGQALVSIDNVTRALGGAHLCQVIDRPIVNIRILGKSERVRIEARGTTIFCNGNNLVLLGDVTRRAIVARLDPKVERPELKQYKNDPVANVMANRGAYIAACLTICRAYFVAGRPKPIPRLASFEAWSNTVPSALVWLGEANATESVETSRTEDPELTELRDMLAVWVRVFGTGWEHRTTTKDVVEMATEKTAGRPNCPDLHAAVAAVAERKGEIKNKWFAVWLRRFKERRVDGLRLTNKSEAGHTEWWIEKSDGAAVPPTMAKPDEPDDSEIPF